MVLATKKLRKVYVNYPEKSNGAIWFFVTDILKQI